MTSTTQTPTATHPPILKAVQTGDGITLYSLPEDTGDPPQPAVAAQVIARLYPPDHPDYAWARTFLAQADLSEGAEPR